MKVNRKFLRSAERLSLSAIAKDSAAQKIVSAVTAIGFVMQPVAALASTITRTLPELIMVPVSALIMVLLTYLPAKLSVT